MSLTAAIDTNHEALFHVIGLISMVIVISDGGSEETRCKVSLVSAAYGSKWVSL